MSDSGHKHHLKQGQAAENAARAYLRGLNREILETNYRCRYGEIDIICRDGDTICFVEVRSRSANSLVQAGESVDHRKQKKLERTARMWLAQQEKDWSCRFDVVEVEWHGGTGTVAGIIEGSFDPSGDEEWG